MSVSKAEEYGRRARNADSVENIGGNVARAIDELIEAIRDLEARVKRLESRAR
jgi:hypothetical protein